MDKDFIIKPEQDTTAPTGTPNYNNIALYKQTANATYKITPRTITWNHQYNTR